MVQITIPSAGKKTYSTVTGKLWTIYEYKFFKMEAEPKYNKDVLEW